MTQTIGIYLYHEVEVLDFAGPFEVFNTATRMYRKTHKGSKPRFKVVTIAGEVYDNDVYIRADGKVKRRNKRPAKKLYGSSHMIGPRELARTCKSDPDVLIIGTGQEGTAELTEDGSAFLKDRGIRVKALPTPRAIREYNRTKGRKAALIHVTC